MNSRLLFFFLFCILSFKLKADDLLQNSHIGGSFQLDSYYYLKDSTIGAVETPEKILSNAYLYLTYSFANFNLSLRYESYQNPIIGFDPRYKGSGFPYLSLNYKSDIIAVTAGNFYEQFGNGMIFRSYEERNLGIDNAINGIKIELTPFDGLQIKGILGKQRNFWSESKSIIRGGDVNFEISTFFPEFFKEYSLNVGGSVISRYQPDLESNYRLPENVFAFATRFDFSAPNFSISTEYAHKYNDPTFRNKFKYNDGNGLNINLSYFAEGISNSLNLHCYDNIEFRTDREAKGLELLLNYLPPLTKQHIFSLPAFYPHSTQGNGEIGLQNELTFTIPPNYFFERKYGTTFELGFSLIKSLDTSNIDEFTYRSPFLGIGRELFYRDINIDIRSKITDNLDIELSFVNIIYNKDVMENSGSPLYGKVKSTTIASEIIYNLGNRQSIRLDLQHMWSKNDSTVAKEDRKNGNWFALLAEYSIAPSWYFSFIDLWNYGNENKDFRVHYLKFALTFIHKVTRIALGFGKDPGGILCVGGVCRAVPTAYGFNLSVTTSF